VDKYYALAPRRSVDRFWGVWQGLASQELVDGLLEQFRMVVMVVVDCLYK
jgi:hypothetical protein